MDGGSLRRGSVQEGLGEVRSCRACARKANASRLLLKAQAPPGVTPAAAQRSAGAHSLVRLLKVHVEKDRAAARCAKPSRSGNEWAPGLTLFARGDTFVGDSLRRGSVQEGLGEVRNCRACARNANASGLLLKAQAPPAVTPAAAQRSAGAHSLKVHVEKDRAAARCAKPSRSGNEWAGSRVVRPGEHCGGFPAFRLLTQARGTRCFIP